MLTILFIVIHLYAELDALELDMESESQGVPSYLQSEPDVEEELNLPQAPTGSAAMPGRANVQVTYLTVCF